MLPSTKITIKANGESSLEVMEKSDSCHKISELGKQAGKVTSDKQKDHIPVYQTVSQKGA